MPFYDESMVKYHQEILSMTNKLQAVFFDCWDTLLEFHDPDKKWNINSLMKHAINKNAIHEEDVFRFTDDFFQKYYRSHLDYELTILQILRLVQEHFHIRLDCPLETCTHEILSYLAPKQVDGADDFLKFLEERHIPYGCLTNTVYPKEDTAQLLRRFYPERTFALVLASGEVGVKKPNPVFFETGVEMLQKNIGSCMYVGDKLLQDAYGSFKAGFAISCFLDWKKEKEKQIHTMGKLSISTDFPYLEVDGYPSLKEYIIHHELA